MKKITILQTIQIPFLLILGWGVLVFLVRPVGEWPFHDGWMYSRSVYYLITQGKWVLCGYQAVSNFFQILWGTLFCLPFGFSMMALRISTLVLGGAGLIFLNRFFLIADKSRAAFWGTVLVLANPLFFFFSLTFMTEVPFLTISILSVFFLFRFFSSGRTKDFLLGVFFSCLACGIRQSALFIPVSFLITILLKEKFKKRAWVLSAVILLGSFLTVYGYYWILKQTVGLPVMQYIKQQIPRLFIHELVSGRLPLHVKVFLKELMYVFIYLGIFCSPLLIFLSQSLWRNFSKRERISGIVLGIFYLIMVSGYLVFAKRIMPLSQMHIYDFGLGYDDLPGGMQYLPKAPIWFWKIITMAGVVFSAFLVVVLSVTFKRTFQGFRGKSKTDYHDVLFCLAALLFSFVPNWLSGHFDRYQIIYLPFMIYIILRLARKMPGGKDNFARGPVFLAGLLCIFLLAIFSVGGTHDFFERNRARWKLLTMVQSRIPADEIDGGYEFNGLYTYAPDYKKKIGMNWWWVKNDFYAVAYGVLPAYDPVLRQTYSKWLPPGPGSVYLLRRREWWPGHGQPTEKTVYEC